MTPLNNNYCPRCGGSGKMPYLKAAGVCFKCHGLGFIPRLSTGEKSEIESSIFHCKNKPVQPVKNEPQETYSPNWLELIFSE
jgi:RecJ-like exonuclease